MAGILRDAIGGIVRAFGRSRLLVAVYLLNLVPALAVSIPFHRVLDRDMSRRVDAPTLLARYSGEFDFDFRHKNAPLFDASQGTLSVVAFGAFLLGALVAGGWIGAFHEPKGGGSLRAFFLWGGREWFRFLRVSVLALLAVHVAGVVTHGKGWEFLLKQFAGVEEVREFANEKTATLVEWGRSAAFLAALAVLFTAADYARVAIVESDRRSALFAWMHGLAFLLRHPFRTGLLFVFFGIVEAAVLFVVGVLLHAGSDRVASGWGVLPLFLLMQAAILARVGLRGARYAAELSLYRKIQAEAAPIQAPVLATRLAGV